MSDITDEMVEVGARQLAALKMGLVNDPNGLRLPDDLWAQAVPQARAVLTAVAPLIRAAALEEAAIAADAAAEHCSISAERANTNGRKLAALLSAYGQECIQAIASAIRDHTKETGKALYFEADKITELRAELALADSLSERQAALLTEVVNALRGDPPSGVHWSHHDAGELAKAAADEIERLREELRLCRAAALEEAAKVAGVEAEKWLGTSAPHAVGAITNAIRALKEHGDE